MEQISFNENVENIPHFIGKQSIALLREFNNKGKTADEILMRWKSEENYDITMMTMVAMDIIQIAYSDHQNFRSINQNFKNIARRYLNYVRESVNVIPCMKATIHNANQPKPSDYLVQAFLEADHPVEKFLSFEEIMYFHDGEGKIRSRDDALRYFVANFSHIMPYFFFEVARNKEKCDFLLNLNIPLTPENMFIIGDIAEEYAKNFFDREHVVRCGPFLDRKFDRVFHFIEENKHMRGK